MSQTPVPQNAMPRTAPPPPHMIPRGNAPAPAAPNAPAGARPQPPANGALEAVLTPSGRGVLYSESRPVLREWIDRLDPIANWVFRVTLIASGLSLAWLLFSIFGNNVGQIAPNDPRGAQVANDMRISAQVLHFSLIFLALSLLILMLDVSWLGPTLAVTGLILHFGSPLALKAIGQSVATVGVVKVLQGTGFALLFFGLCKYSVDLFRWLTQLPDRMKARADVGVSQKAEAAQQRVARDATMFSPCWKLPYCREVIRKQCPAFLAKKRCWKFGRGCYCDEEMISRIIRGESIDTIKAPTRQSRQGKPPCGRCHIFLEHQGLKYKMMSPLAIPGTIVGMYAIWPFYSTAFTAVSQRMDMVWNRLSFDPRNLTPDSVRARDDIKLPTANEVSQLTPEQISHYAMVMFGVILGFFVLIYISKFIEWAIFKAKW
ncbi:MAG: hypothetical protein JWN98_2201 [Abditibacteriota bacterium]|nr:hypothetical protein [Abditibacteriota bacterium]